LNKKKKTLAMGSYKNKTLNENTPTKSSSSYQLVTDQN